jgi:anti-sigma regulatory factor (Ser/Thr protein kinase)
MSATPPFAAIKTAPGLARGHVRATLAEWGLGEYADDAQRIASELVANAVNASAPVLAGGRMLVIRVCLLTDGDVLTIECWDQAPGFPVLRTAMRWPKTDVAWPSSTPSPMAAGAASPPLARTANAYGERSRCAACHSGRSWPELGAYTAGLLLRKGARDLIAGIPH